MADESLLVDRANARRVLTGGGTFLTFAGGETYLLFQQGFPLREFCAFEVLRDEAAMERMAAEVVRPILDAAAAGGHGVITDCFLWRASPDYMAKLGYAPEDVRRFNHEGVAALRRLLADAARRPGPRPGPLVLAADPGPRGDGYALKPGQALDATAARDYHRPQLAAIAETDAAVVTALTMTNVPEAVGLGLAARDLGLPLIMSPTVETDGTVPDGTPIGEFITRVDDALGGDPIFYMVNCAYPTHLEPTLERARQRGEGWLARFRGFRSNASSKSHQELDESTAIDRGDVADVAAGIARMQQRYGLWAFGGCCGTDAEHLRAIAAACRR
jgi:S-methylmethionine-dependent homocysteine/selenocysteine methylase